MRSICGFVSVYLYLGVGEVFEDLYPCICILVFDLDRSQWRCETDVIWLRRRRKHFGWLDIIDRTWSHAEIWHNFQKENRPISFYLKSNTLCPFSFTGSSPPSFCICWGLQSNNQFTNFAYQPNCIVHTRNITESSQNQIHFFLLICVFALVYLHSRNHSNSGALNRDGMPFFLFS